MEFICNKCDDNSPCTLSFYWTEDSEYPVNCPFPPYGHDDISAEWKKLNNEKIMKKESEKERFVICGNCENNDETCSMCASCVSGSNFVPKTKKRDSCTDRFVQGLLFSETDCHAEKRPASTPEPMSWDEYFLNLAASVALKSKDESNKIGAVIVGPDHEIRSTGYNGLPRGMNDNDPARQERPLKYKYFEHAERNAIYNAARFGASTNGCTMYCLWPPCSDCARAIIQAGINRLVVGKPIIACPQRWHSDITLAVEMLRKCVVEFVVFRGGA